MTKHTDNQDRQDQRGFASMNDKKQREIAAEGGRAAHELTRKRPARPAPKVARPPRSSDAKP